MVDINSDKYERNGIKAIADNYRILRLNEQHTEERLDLKICEKFQSNIIQFIENIDMN